MSAPDLQGAATVVDVANDVVTGAARLLASHGSIDDHQVLAYDLAHAAAAVELARSVLDYGARGEVEARIACAFVADAVHDLMTRVLGREHEWGVKPDGFEPVMAFLATYRDPAFLAALAGEEGPRHLDADFELVRDTFRRFADDKVRPVAEHVHRTNADIPEDVIAGLAEMGGFGLSVPEEYGGFASGGESDYLGMVVATEELSRGSLGVGGSLITRPEILTRALVKGGTEEQKQVAAEDRVGRDHGGGRRHRARLRVRRGRHQGHRHAGDVGRCDVGRWSRMGGQRGQDVVHVRGARRRADAAGPHRPRPVEDPPRPQPVHRAQAARRRPRLRVRAGDGRASSRGAPSTPSATAACTPTRSRSTTGSCPPPTRSAARRGWARASTSRWRGSRTAASRPRRAPSA